jgi:hypothetical protein
MKAISTLKRLRFVACAPRRAVLKHCLTVRAIKRPEFSIFLAVKRICNVVDFTRREILEEISLRDAIHPSIERTVLRHE